MTRTFFLLALAPLVGCAYVQDDTVVVDEPVHTLLASVTRGSLTVEVGDVVHARVERHVHSGLWDVGSAFVQVDDGRLWVVGSCDAEDERCSTDIRVVVPADVTATVDVAFGDLAVSGIQGDLGVKTQSGDITVRDAGGRVSAEAFEGSIDLERVAGAIEAAIDDGDIVGRALSSTDVSVSGGRPGNVALDFLAPVEAVDVTAEGDIDLALPAGAYDLDLNADQGTVTTEGVSDVAGESAVYARSAAGDVTVTGE